MSIAPIIPSVIENRIFVIRGERVIQDADLALLYGVSTKALKQAVRRNRSRFPEDFMLEFREDELKNLRSQFVTSKFERCLLVAV